MNYDFLKGQDLSGMMFYYPEEYQSFGTVYTIDRKYTDTGLDDIVWSFWFDDEFGDEDWGEATENQIIEMLNKGIWKLLSSEKEFNTYDAFDSLNESEEKKYKPKIGDYLYVHENRFMYGRRSRYVTKGNVYKIIDVESDSVRIVDDEKTKHKLSHGFIYEHTPKVFTVIPKEEFEIDPFENLYEQTIKEEFTIEPKVGDYVYCFKPLINKHSRRQYTTEGNYYEIIDVLRYKNFIINDDGGDDHELSLNFAKDYFQIIPKDQIDNFKNFDPFENLYESVNKDNLMEIRFEDFQVGLPIVVDGTYGGFSGKIWDNKEGEIIEYNENFPAYLVVFDNWFDGHQGHDSHTGHDRCKKQNCWWFTPRYAGIQYYTYSSDALFDKLYENEDPLQWAQDVVDSIPTIVDIDNVKIGSLVVRNENWGYGNQDSGSIYGVVTNIIDRISNYTNDDWVSVDWVNENGDRVYTNDYDIGPEEYSLKFYRG